MPFVPLETTDQPPVQSEGFIPLGKQDWSSLIRNEAKTAGLDPEQAVQLATFESGLSPSAVSSAGAYGLMQVMPFPNRGNIKDPINNIRKGLELWKDALQKAGGDPDKAYRMGYNPGYTGRSPFGTGNTPTPAPAVAPAPKTTAAPDGPISEGKFVSLTKPEIKPTHPVLNALDKGAGWIQGLENKVGDWFHKTPIGAPRPVTVRGTNGKLNPQAMRIAELAGMSIDEAGNVYNESGKQVTDTELQYLLMSGITGGKTGGIAGPLGKQEQATMLAARRAANAPAVEASRQQGFSQIQGILDRKAAKQAAEAAARQEARQAPFIPGKLLPNQKPLFDPKTLGIEGHPSPVTLPREPFPSRTPGVSEFEAPGKAVRPVTAVGKDNPLNLVKPAVPEPRFVPPAQIALLGEAKGPAAGLASQGISRLYGENVPKTVRLTRTMPTRATEMPQGSISQAGIGPSPSPAGAGASRPGFRGIQESARTVDEAIDLAEGRYKAEVGWAVRYLRSPEWKKLPEDAKRLVRESLHDPAVQLPSTLQTVKEQYIKPVLQKFQSLYARLKGIDPNLVADLEEPGADPFGRTYFPRLAIDEGRKTGGLGSRKLGVPEGSLHSRRFFKVQGPNGTSFMGQVIDRQLQIWNSATKDWVPVGRDVINPMPGKIVEVSTKGETLGLPKGEKLTLGTATPQELEAAGIQKYHPDPLYTAAVQYGKLVKRDETLTLAEHLSKDPRYNNLISATPRPGFSPVKGVPGLTGKYAHPLMQRVLGKLRRSFDTNQIEDVLDAVNRMSLNVSFVWAFGHAPNFMANAFGELGAMLPAGIKAVRNVVRATNEVTQLGDDFLQFVREGFPAQHIEWQASSLDQRLWNQIGDHLKTNPGQLEALAKAAGVKAEDLAHVFSDFSHSVTWGGDSIVRLSTLYDLMDAGLSRTDALKYVNQAFPNYVTPGFWKSPIATSLAQNIVNGIQGTFQMPLLVVFSRWHNGLLAGITKTPGQILGKGVPASTRALAASRAAVWALGLTVIKPAVEATIRDHLLIPRAQAELQKNPMSKKAKEDLRRAQRFHLSVPGYGGVIEAGQRVADAPPGHRLSAAAQSTASIMSRSPVANIPIGLWQAQQGDPGAAIQTVTPFGLPQQISNVAVGKSNPLDLAMSLGRGYERHFLPAEKNWSDDVKKAKAVRMQIEDLFRTNITPDTVTQAQTMWQKLHDQLLADAKAANKQQEASGIRPFMNPEAAVAIKLHQLRMENPYEIYKATISGETRPKTLMNTPLY